MDAAAHSECRTGTLRVSHTQYSPAPSEGYRNQEYFTVSGFRVGEFLASLRDAKKKTGSYVNGGRAAR